MDPKARKRQREEDTGDVSVERAITLQLAQLGQPSRFNKLRKLVCKSGSFGWTPFTEAVDSMVARGILKDETVAEERLISLPEGQKEVTLGKGPGSKGTKKSQAKPDTAAPAAKKQKQVKKQKAEAQNPKGKVSEDGDEDDEDGGGEEQEEDRTVQHTMEVPKEVIVRMLQSKGQKLKNIEANSKTHIQLQKKESVSDDERPRSLTITGKTEKSVNVAQILIKTMVRAVSRAQQRKGPGPSGKGERQPSGPRNGGGGERHKKNTHEKKSTGTGRRFY